MITVMLLTAFLMTPFGLFFLMLAAFKKPSLRMNYAFFVGLLFGMIGYCTRPLRTIDISRYFEQIDGIRELPFSSAANWMDDGLLIKNVIFWFVAKLGDNQILPFLSLFTIYFIVAYILADSLEDSREELFGRLLILLIMLVPFYNSFSNVRNVSAFALLELAVYRDLYRKKRDLMTMLLYIVPCYIHLTGIVVLVVRFCIPLLKRMSYLGTALIFTIPTAVVAFYPRLRSISLPGNIGKVINRAILKAYASVVRTSDYAQEMQSSGSFVVNRLIAAVFCILLFYLIVQYQKINRSRDNGKFEYSLFVEVITIISFMMAVMGVVKYWVFMFLVYISCVPVLIEFAGKRNRKRSKEYYDYLMIWAVAGVRALLQIRTMLNNLDIPGFMERILFTNYPVVVIRFIKGLIEMW